MLWVAAFMLILVLVVPLLPYAIAQSSGPIAVPNPGTELWRELRGARQGKTQVQGVDSGVLIRTGDAWRTTRNCKAGNVLCCITDGTWPGACPPARMPTQAEAMGGY